MKKINTIEAYVYNIQQVNRIGTFPTSGLSIIENEFADIKLMGRIAFYQGDTTINPIVNCVFLDNGNIIAARSNGTIVLRTLLGVESVLLTIAGSDQWRGLFRSKNGIILVSPYHSTNREDNGIWKLNSDGTGFTQVCSWYNIAIEDEATIWQFIEDKNGYFYAGVYDQATKKPQIFKSINGGETWDLLVDFNTYLGITRLSHVHALHYDKWNDSIYVSLGEGDYNYKSIDCGETWIKVCDGMGKMTAIVATPYYRIFGTDVGGASDLLSLEVYITSDDILYQKVLSTWSQNLFGFRLSDVTGWIYGYTLIDSSVNVTSYFPPIDAITDPVALQTWKDTNPLYLSEWESYNLKYENEYPDDCIRPQHASIICSKDGGLTWEVLYKYFCNIWIKRFLYCF